MTIEEVTVDRPYVITTIENVTVDKAYAIMAIEQELTMTIEK